MINTDRCTDGRTDYGEAEVAIAWIEIACEIEGPHWSV